MGEFDDLFERAIPRDEALDYVRELQKLAVSMNWVHKATTRGARAAPTERLLEVAGRSARGAGNAARLGNADAAKKRLLLRSKTLDEALHRGKAAEDLALLKEAVSAEWVANAARNAAHTVSPRRLNEVAGGSMKGVLNAAKAKSPLRQAHVDKRMALRSSVLGGQATRIDTVRPPAFQKAAGGLKLALAAQTARQALEPSAEQVMLAERTGMMQQSAQENLALRDELEQSQALLQENAQAAEQAQQVAQQSQEDLAQAEMASQEQAAQAEQAMAQAQEQAAMAQQEAQQQAAEAAAQADGKMRLSIRIQQMRQQLADLASQDPVTEEGEQAAPIQTAMQQGMGDPSMDPAAMDPNADPAMAGQDPAAVPPGAAPPGAEAGMPPAAAGGAAPAESKPKAKPKPKAKEESKAAPKTEIKIGSAQLVKLAIEKAKGIRRVGQLLAGTRKSSLVDAHGKAKDIKREFEGLLRQAGEEHPKLQQIVEATGRAQAHEANVGRHLADEARAVRITRTGTGAGIAGAGVGGYRATTRKKEHTR